MTHAVFALALVPLLSAGDLPLDASVEVELFARGGQYADAFGWSLALSPDRILVSALIASATTYRDGAVYVYRREAGEWVQEERLQDALGETADHFGSSLDFDGTTAVVGARQSGPAGAVFVWERSGTTWTEQARIVPSGAGAGDLVGDAVDLEGDTLLVGSPRWDASAVHSNVGAIDVFVRVGVGGPPVWAEQARLLAPAPDLQRIGERLALSGDTAVASSPGGFVDHGRVFVYERTGTTWALSAELLASDSEIGDYFGGGLALEGDRLLVGAFNDDDAGVDAGAVYVFERSGSSWTETAKLVAADASPDDAFGTSIALDGDRAVVGGVRGQVAYVFAYDGAAWRQEERLFGAGGAEDQFAARVGILGETVVVTSRNSNGAVLRTGSAHVYSVAEGSGFCDGGDGSLAACPCGNAGAFDRGCDNAQGTGGVRTAISAFDAQAQTATLEAEGFPPTATPTAVVVRGNGREGAPALLFDGVRCVSLDGFVRFAATAASAGLSLHTLNHGAGPGTYYYQVWYRNTPGTFCDAGAAANVSSGTAIRW